MTKPDGQTGPLGGDIGPQMAFPLRRPATFTAERFITSPSNAAARAWLSRKGWPDGRLWLWGPAGTGKTHLLSVWAQEYDATVLDARLFSRSSSGGAFAYKVISPLITPIRQGTRPLCFIF